MKPVRMLFLTMTVIFFAASCSKDKNERPAEDVSVKGRWNVTTILTVEPGADPYTYTGKTGDFVEFKEDGTMSSSVDGFEQTVAYEMVDATHIMVDGSLSEIKQLTNNTLVVLDPAHEGQVEDITYSLTK